MAYFKPPRPLLQLAVTVLLACTMLIVLLLNQSTEISEDKTRQLANQNQTCPLKCNCTKVDRKHGRNKALVDCSNKELSRIPSDIPVDTQILLLDGNSISKIDGEMANLSQLEELHMVDNKLQEIESGDLDGLTSLSLFYLTRNQLSDWPDLCNDVGSSLTHLGIDENQLKGSPAPPSYANCTQLQSLILTKNTFPHLTNATLAALGAAGSLKSVKLNSVKMTAVDPTALVPLAEHLTNLDLSQNQELPVKQLVAAFNAASFTNQFVGLTMKSTGWTELPEGFLPNGHFPSLDILHLDGSSKLSTIHPDALAGGSSLTHLFLKECPLNSLDAQLAGLNKLTDLNLAKSSLSRWTSATFSQPNLRRLDLSSAKIVSIGGLDGASENPLPNLANLADDGLRIGGNPLVCNCSLLWLTKQLGTDAIRKKFYQLDKIMCYDEASGKSIKLTDCKPVNCNSTTTTESPSTTATTTITTTTFNSTTAMKTTTPTASSTASSPTEAPAIPSATKPPRWFLPVVISGCVLGAALLLVGSAFLARRLRQRQQLGADGELQRSLIGDDGGSDDESGGSDCFKLISRRSQNPRQTSSASAAADEPSYTAVDAVA